MKRYRWIIWIIVIAIAGTAIWYWKFREKETPVVLETEQPVMGYIASSVTATGTIQPVDTVSVGTQVSGTVSDVYADFNSTVKKGQLIAQIDKSLFMAQVQQISANLQQAKSQVVFQESNFNRQKSLYDIGAISKAEYENAVYQKNIAKDNVTSVASQLDAAQRNLSFASIYSPMDGTVMARNVSVGQTVAASFNTPTLFVIAKDLTKMQVRAAVDEADIGNVKKGQRVTFTVDAFPEDVFEGNVKD
ncbi:MAG: efflux RND transporter periplasmic adaptor subunit, partial [Sphingobacteriales bacterium]